MPASDAGGDAVKTWSVPMMQLVDVLQLQLTQGGVTVLTVTGTSMHPTFRHKRDRVKLVKRKPKKHDVILYKRDNGAYVLHRIVKLGSPHICCGDNQWQTEPVREDQILAVAEGFTRNGTYRTVHDWSYRLWVFIWMGLRPVRRPILAVRNFLRRFRRKSQ